MIGDELLKTVGNILSEFMKPENCLSRYGGDEFSVIIKSDPSQGNFLDIFPLLMEISELFSKKKLSILDKYLNIVENTEYNSRKEKKDSLIACFYFLDSDDDDLVAYRRKLSSLLF
jgi:GGDEF domain-containing protein